MPFSSNEMFESESLISRSMPWTDATALIRDLDLFPAPDSTSMTVTQPFYRFASMVSA